MTILLVDDDKDILENNMEYLRKHGYETLTAEHASQALAQYERADIIVLDVTMPDVDGFSLAKQLHTLTTVPILFLTARKTERDMEASFSLGSDYMCKPYSLKELLLRIESLLKKRSGSRDAIISLPPIQIDTIKQAVIINEQEIIVTRYEYIILLLLIRNKNEILSHHQIYKEVWGEHGFQVSPVAQHVSAIRRKLSENGANGHIQTIRGVGYSFVYPSTNEKGEETHDQ